MAVIPSWPASPCPSIPGVHPPNSKLGYLSKHTTSPIVLGPCSMARGIFSTWPTLPGAWCSPASPPPPPPSSLPLPHRDPVHSHPSDRQLQTGKAATGFAHATSPGRGMVLAQCSAVTEGRRRKGRGETWALLAEWAFTRQRRWESSDPQDVRCGEAKGLAPQAAGRTTTLLHF